MKLGSLFSITLSSLAVTNQVAIVSAASCEGKEEVKTKIDFFDADLIENTLHYPDQSGRLRYENVGLFKGDSIDLVVTQNPDAPAYSTDMWIRNGYNRGTDPENPDTSFEAFGNINVMTKDPRDDSVSDEDQALMDGEGTFDFCFYYTGTESLATVDSFDWSVYDMDQRGGGLNEKFTIDTSQAESYSVNGDSEIKIWCENKGPDTAVANGNFQYDDWEGKKRSVDRYAPVTCDPGVKTIFHSTTTGKLEDNPTNPENLTKQQTARSISFRFTDTSCWTFKYEHYCPCGNYCEEEGGGRADKCDEWCPKSKNDHKNYDPKYPNACKSYTGGNFLFAGSADLKITEEGECITPSPTPAPEPTNDCLGEFVESSAITKIDLYNSEVTSNTLHLPGGELRYESAGFVRDRPVDLVVTIEGGDYTDITEAWDERGLDYSNMNGRKPDAKFGNINLQTVINKPQSGEGNFKFCFRDHETNELTKVENFRWSVFDLDERQDDVAKKGIGIKEKMLMDISQVSAYQLYPNESGSEITMICEDGTAIPCAQGVRTVFHSSTAGTAKDNPDDPNNMTEQQKERSITFTFQDTDCWTFTYDHYCPVEQDHEKVFPLGYDPQLNTNVGDKTKCRGYSGGNFLFSGDAEEIIKDGECITPPPTTAPLPTEAPTSSPVKTPTQSPVAPPPERECIRDVTVKKTVGVTEYPLIPTKPVKILDVDGDKSVTVALFQSWTDGGSSVGHIFASYKADLWDQKCFETKDAVGGGAFFDVITVQCNIMSPRAHLEICVADELSNGALKAGDNAVIPKCCYPELPPDHGKVCYSLEISCNAECIDQPEEILEDRRLLRGNEEN